MDVTTFQLSIGAGADGPGAEMSGDSSCEDQQHKNVDYAGHLVWGFAFSLSWTKVVHRKFYTFSHCVLMVSV